MNFPVGVTEQLGLKLFWVGCPPGGAENIRKLRQKVAWPQKKWDFPWTWNDLNLAIPSHLYQLVDQKRYSSAMVIFQWMFLKSISAFPWVDCRFPTSQRWTWPCHPHVECAARNRWGAERHPSQRWKHPNRAVVHSVNNPFVSICSAICSEFMWIPVNPTTTCLHRVKRMVVNCPDSPPKKPRNSTWDGSYIDRSSCDPWSLTNWSMHNLPKSMVQIRICISVM